MNRHSIRVVRLAVAGALFAFAAGAQAQVEIQWWHSMTGALNDRVNDFAKGFNESQKDYKVVPVYKGAYPESMAAAIAAFRAGNAPHILQVFEVGTATMMGAKGAIVPVQQVMTGAGEKFDPKAYIPSVAGYYTTSKGQMLSFPFNSSTAVFYYNKDMFEKAGIDPNRAPATWPEVMAAAARIKTSGTSQCAYTTGWPSWVHVENFSAWHNVPIATRENGMAGLDTVFQINSPLHVRHWNNLKEWAGKGYFTYGGRTNQAEAKFYSGECAMLTSSSAAQANINRNAKFKYGVAFMPYYADVAGAPQNSIIGGASLWVMSGKKPNEYKGVAKFFTYLANPARQAQWHQTTGYLPITPVAYDLTKNAGFYEKNPGTDVSVRQMLNKPPTANSKGLRFGSFVQIRDMFQEEFENMLAGKQDAKTALDNSVKRGNEMLRRFQKTTKE
ncbi:MAG: sn-glycerol-3-phosphate ABC transporter substrate-binding protein UgpB [Betaproteobacteria bacterium]|jgi:sn-glycerol 3-phosphate transport system substrate-binding protein|nr:sn-glycerol-3-phosphate ABC transporter substrate-binding protein UgpB [Betaproteobacteria bacterium]